MTKEISTVAKPFLRWAGGKRWLLKYLSAINNIEIRTYYEPFLGGGSVFFSLQNVKHSVLSDLNPDLVNAYQALKNDAALVIKRLKTFENNENFYYKLREMSYKNIYDEAARFIFLNKTCFNGIYRVNRSGKFNVPYGFRRKDMDLIDESNLFAVGKRLQHASIKCQDFEKTLNRIKPGDFVFLDPPYTVAHENNGFVQYNQKIFSLDDQFRLAEYIKQIKKVGAYYVLTNAKHKAILDIYKAIEKPTVFTRCSRVGGAGARREGFNEYIFTNCL